jgi:hypothetical protein
VRVRTTSSTFLNPLCPAILCWKDGCFCAILYKCTELEIAKKHGDSWGGLMTHFDHGTRRFDRARSLELLHLKFSMVVSAWAQIMQWPDECWTRKSRDA